MKVLVELGYDGRAYHGWQVQDNAPSVQGAVGRAAETLLKAPCAVTGCSRTDAGVHARQYFCTFESDALDGFPLEKLPEALNRLLPPDVAAFSARKVGPDFHARYSAAAKEYEYRICCRRIRDPFLGGSAYMIPGAAPDVSAMRHEARALVGTHDFSSFCASGGKPGDRVRTVYFCEVREEDGMILLSICANGFLYNMVRIVAGTLLECGEGRLKNVSQILEARSRNAAGKTLPPQGLCLNRVYYDLTELEERVAGVLKEASSGV